MNNSGHGSGVEWFTMENPFVQKQHMTLARGQFREQQLQIQTDAVTAWLNMLFPERPGGPISNSQTALLDVLKDGVMLCELLAKIAPETGLKPLHAGKAYQLENISHYLRLVRGIGVRTMIDAADVTEGRIAKVLSHLLDVGQAARKRGFKPCIGDKPQPPPSAVAKSSAAQEAAAPSVVASPRGTTLTSPDYEHIDDEDLEVPEATIDDANLKQYEKIAEDMLKEKERLQAEKEAEEEKKRQAEEEAQKLKEELERIRKEKEAIAAENAKLKTETRLPFGNTEATTGEKDCYMARYIEDGTPGRLCVLVVSIDGISVLEPFTEVLSLSLADACNTTLTQAVQEVIFSALWRRIRSWGINYAGDMFKLDYLPLRYTDEGTVGAWFSCQNGSLMLDSIMKWIAKKKEQLQQEQEQAQAQAQNQAKTNSGSNAAVPAKAERKTSLLKRMVGKGSK